MNEYASCASMNVNNGGKRNDKAVPPYLRGNRSCGTVGGGEGRGREEERVIGTNVTHRIGPSGQQKESDMSDLEMWQRCLWALRFEVSKEIVDEVEKHVSAKINALEAERDMLWAALEPFAYPENATISNSAVPDDMWLDEYGLLTVAMVRRARSALAAKEENDG